MLFGYILLYTNKVKTNYKKTLKTIRDSYHSQYFIKLPKVWQQKILHPIGLFQKSPYPQLRILDIQGGEKKFVDIQGGQ